METHTVVAIDGPAGSGKSTAARLVAVRLGYTLLDTGALYRALALTARRSGVAWEDGPAVAALARDIRVSFYMDGERNRVRLNGQDVSEAIRTPDISRGASVVSQAPEVREALLDVQRDVATRGPVVAEGRDVGTVVFPGAAVKVFLEADPRERARRRAAELWAMGHEVDLDDVLAQQAERDRLDATREVAPLRAAPDATILDTTGLSIDQVVDRIVNRVPAAPRAGHRTGG